MASPEPFIPKPKTKMVFQDHRGERYVISSVGRTLIWYTPLGDDSSNRKCSIEAWNFGFKHRGWLTV